MASASLFCVLLATAAGCMLTLAAVVVAYPAERARRYGHQRSNCSISLSVMANLIFVGMGTGLNMVAVGYGAVAIVTPVSTGANLLSNMLLQQILGIANYTQNAIIGTLVLASAVVMLIQVGPADIDADAPVLDLVKTPQALIFLSVVFLTQGYCFCAIRWSWVTQNIHLVICYCIVGGSSTVINVAVTKLVQMDVPFVVRVPLVLLYLILATLGLSSDVKANSELDDPSLFIPVGAGVSLLLTCLAGLCVWGDGERLALGLSYAMVYVLVVLGGYLVASQDLLGTTNHNVLEQGVQRARALTVAPTRVSFANMRNALMKDWEDEELHPAAPRGTRARNSRVYAMARTMTSTRSNGSVGEPLDSLEALREHMISAWAREQLDGDDFIDLSISLLREPWSAAACLQQNPVLLLWLDKNRQKFEGDFDHCRTDATTMSDLAMPLCAKPSLKANR